MKMTGRYQQLGLFSLGIIGWYLIHTPELISICLESKWLKAAHLLHRIEAFDGEVWSILVMKLVCALKAFLLLS